uniref:Exonuclease domain-containing protein n=1 Tax=Sciurus vulgaris TaxID=55149 RepID=A0A8D2B9P9_SCIVU
AGGVPEWKMVALDCEMVGRGPKGHVSSMARCSIVNYDGDVLYDEYIFPPCHIVYYQTKWSGICKKRMENATPFKIAWSQILKIILGKIVVGHAIHNDFKALQYFQPKSFTGDISQITPPQLESQLPGECHRVSEAPHQAAATSRHTDRERWTFLCGRCPGHHGAIQVG